MSYPLLNQLTNSLLTSKLLKQQKNHSNPVHMRLSNTSTQFGTHSPLKRVSTTVSLLANNQNQQMNYQDSQEEIQLLKRKLVQTHRKLMEELDNSKEKEKIILQLTRHNTQLKAELENEPSMQVAQADVQAIRTRLLGQILEKNKAQQDLKLLTQKHSKLQEQYVLLKDQLTDKNEEVNILEKRLEAMRKKTENTTIEYEKILKQLEQIKTDYKISAQNLTETERLLKEQRTAYKEVSDVNKNLHGKILLLEGRIDQLQEQNIDLRNKYTMDATEKAALSHKNHEIEKLVAEVNKLTSGLREKEKELEDVRVRAKALTKNKDYQETKLLIQKLEEAEKMTRNKTPSRSVVSSNIQQLSMRGAETDSKVGELAQKRKNKQQYIEESFGLKQSGSHTQNKSITFLDNSNYFDSFAANPSRFR